MREWKGPKAGTGVLALDLVGGEGRGEEVLMRGPQADVWEEG